MVLDTLGTVGKSVATLSQDRVVLVIRKQADSETLSLQSEK